MSALLSARDWLRGSVSSVLMVTRHSSILPSLDLLIFSALGTMFHQQLKICHWWFYVDCESSEQFYNLDLDLDMTELSIENFARDRDRARARSDLGGGEEEKEEEASSLLAAAAAPRRWRWLRPALLLQHLMPTCNTCCYWAAPAHHQHT